MASIDFLENTVENVSKHSLGSYFHPGPKNRFPQELIPFLGFDVFLNSDS